AHEGAVHEHLQLFGQVRSLRLPARGAHLQIIGGGLVIPGLRRLQESKHGSRRRPTSQFIGGRRSCCLSLCPTRQQAGRRLSQQRPGHQPMERNANEKNQQRQFFHRGSSMWSAGRPRPAVTARVGTGALASLPSFAEAPSEPGPPSRPLLARWGGEAEGEVEGSKPSAARLPPESSHCNIYRVKITCVWLFNHIRPSALSRTCNPAACPARALLPPEASLHLHQYIDNYASTKCST